MGKKENRYIKEFIEHYLKYGVDKIFLYDNNDINDEIFENTISEYIKNEYVKIINVRGQKGVQKKCMNECYQKNIKEYEWFIFYDIDEFIFLKNIKNLKYYLYQTHFNKCQVIQLNWVIHNDNNLLNYDNRSLKERFPEKSKSLNKSIDIKSIVRGNIKTKIISMHYINKKLIACDGFGRIKKKNIIIKQRDYKYYYIDHYYTKSTEEFIEKIMRGSVNTGRIRYTIISNYFEINKITLEKINYIENKTLLKLNKFRQK